MMRICLPLLCTALLALSPAAAVAQQALVPARPLLTPQTPAAEWPGNSRAAEVIRQQEQRRPRTAGQGGLDGVEAGAIYQNYIRQIGKPSANGSNGSGFGEPSQFGSGNSSGYGQSR